MSEYVCQANTVHHFDVERSVEDVSSGYWYQVVLQRCCYYYKELEKDLKAAVWRAAAPLHSSCWSGHSKARNRGSNKVDRIRMGHLTGSHNVAIRYLSLLRLALPSILLQSGAPLAITVQTALLGRKATSLVAAWAIVATATNAATVVFNFLVVGVTAKVSKVVGGRAWSLVGSRIRLALISAVSMGVVASLLLLAIKPWLFELLENSPEARTAADHYFALRVFGVPPQLLAMCTSGILQGYKRVYLVAGIQVLRLVIDVTASYVALYVFDIGIKGVGIGNLLASSTSAVLAFICILALPPDGAKGKIHVFRKCPTRAASGGGVSGGFKWTTEKDAIKAPLLTDKEAEVGARVVNGEINGHKENGVNGELSGDDSDSDSEFVHHALEENTWKFIWDGLSTMLRSAMVQASFFLVLASVTALGVHAVAAHQVVMQLWMITVYIADGFATAGTIVGSDLAGKMEKSHTAKERDAWLADLKTMTNRVLIMGTTAGVCIGLVYWALEGYVMGLFTYDPLTKDMLRQVWPWLIIVQPLNAIVFVYDGIIYAAQAFSYMATCLTIGFFVIFLPIISLAHYHFKTLLSAWAAKAGLNVVRLVVASYKIHFDFLSPSPFPAPLEEVVTTDDTSVGTEHVAATPASDSVREQPVAAG